MFGGWIFTEFGVELGKQWQDVVKNGCACGDDRVGYCRGCGSCRRTQHPTAFCFHAARHLSVSASAAPFGVLDIATTPHLAKWFMRNN